MHFYFITLPFQNAQGVWFDFEWKLRIFFQIYFMFTSIVENYRELYVNPIT